MEGRQDKNVEKERVQKQIEAYTTRRKEWLKRYPKESNVMETIATHSIAFMEEHSDAKDYVLFHTLIGSTPPPHLTRLDTKSPGVVAELYNEIEKALDKTIT